MVGLAIGGAYLAGGMARAAVVHAQISRLAADSKDFSNTSLAEGAAEDPGALALARRLDAYAVAEADQQDRRLIAYAEKLEARHEGRGFAPGMIQRASLTRSNQPITPARPFQLRGVLEQSRDLECLTQAVYYEARGETREGQQAVAQVVLNRTRHPAFPKTVCGVVFQRVRSTCQFSFACDGSVARRVELKAWSRAEQVAAQALAGSVAPEVGNATHFHVARVSPSWRNSLQRVAQVGAHVFYRFGGRAGSAHAFDETPELSDPIVPAMPAADETQPILASLSLAPLANTVATTVANGVAATAQAGADLVMAAAGSAKAATQPRAEPAEAPKPAAAPAPASVAPVAMAPVQTDPAKPAETAPRS
jgi:spore germination cell wall hydrolase CwlJ-like protein